MAVDLTGSGQWLSGNLAAAIPLNSDWSMFSWIKRPVLAPTGIQEAPLTLYSQTGSSKNLAVHIWLTSSLGIGGQGNDGVVFLESPSVAIDASLNDVWVPVLITSKRTGGASLTTVYTPLGTATETSDLYMDYQKLGISIGASSQIGGNYWKGYSAHNAAWDKTLTAADYATLSAGGGQPSGVEAGNLVCHFPLLTDKVDSTGNVTLTTYGTANIIVGDPYDGLAPPAPTGDIDYDTLPITHPGTYKLRGMLLNLYNRASAAGDTAQYSAVLAELVQANTNVIAGNPFDRNDAVVGSHVHFPRQFMIELSHIAHRASLIAEGGTAIAVDLAALTAAFGALAAP